MDGEVNSQDAAAVLVYTARLSVGMEDVVLNSDPRINRWLLLLVDVNGDNTIDSKDAVYILNYAAQISIGKNVTWSDIINGTVN